MLFYAAFIAICLSNTLWSDCDKGSALHWVVVPERQDNLVGCFSFGAEYIVRTSLVIPGKTYPKIFCEPMQEP